jgi:tetratricopeptide (TPR) repeat protein
MDWTKFTPATCLPDCWCEAPRIGSFILEPVNSWTNFIFVLLGLFLIFFDKKIPYGSNFLSMNRGYSRVYGSALIFLGFGSFLFHASQTFVGQWFDVFGMYLVSAFFVGTQRAVILEKLNKIPEAIAVLEKLAQDKEAFLAAKINLELGRLNLMNGEKGKAQTHFEYVINTFPNDEQAKLAKLYMGKLAQ